MPLTAFVRHVLTLTPALAALSLLAGCGRPDAFATLDEASPESGHWGFADEVVVEATDEAPVLEGWSPVALRPTSERTTHRVGWVVDAAEGPGRYRARAWVRAESDADADALLEIGGGYEATNTVNEYGVAYFDLGEVRTDNPYRIPESDLLADPAIETDGAWRVISGELELDGEQVFVTVGIVSYDANAFPGERRLTLTLGGIEVERLDE